MALQLPATLEARALRADLGKLGNDETLRNIAWMSVIDGLADDEIARAFGTQSRVIEKLKRKGVFRTAVALVEHGLARERMAAIARYAFELEQLVGKAVGRIKGILDDANAPPAVVLKAAETVLDRVGMSGAKREEHVLRFDIPDHALSRIESALRARPEHVVDEARWKFALVKPTITVEAEVIDDEPTSVALPEPKLTPEGEPVNVEGDDGGPLP